MIRIAITAEAFEAIGRAEVAFRADDGRMALGAARATARIAGGSHLPRRAARPTRVQNRCVMQSDLDKAAGAALRELRIAAGLSQEDISFAADIDQSTLSKVERLGPAAVGWARFCRIVEALGHEVQITYQTAGTAKKITSAATPASARRL